MPERPAPQSESYLANRYFSDIFPDAVVMPVSLQEFGEEIDNLRRYGLGMAELFFPDDPDNHSYYATYILHPGIFTEALDSIHRLEFVEAALPAGSHAKAIDDMVQGSFEQYWGEFL